MNSEKRAPRTGNITSEEAAQGGRLRGFMGCEKGINLEACKIGRAKRENWVYDRHQREGRKEKLQIASLSQIMKKKKG
jgi:hypothetical protein